MSIIFATDRQRSKTKDEKQGDTITVRMHATISPEQMSGNHEKLFRLYMAELTLAKAGFSKSI